MRESFFWGGLIFLVVEVSSNMSLLPVQVRGVALSHSHFTSNTVLLVIKFLKLDPQPNPTSSDIHQTNNLS